MALNELQSRCIYKVELPCAPLQYSNNRRGQSYAHSSHCVPALFDSKFLSRFHQSFFVSITFLSILTIGSSDAIHLCLRLSSQIEG